MKILTNSHSGIGGISRTLDGLCYEIVNNYKDSSLVFVYENRMYNRDYKASNDNVTLYSLKSSLKEISKLDKTNISTKDLSIIYKSKINQIQNIITKENPDIILIIGTFYSPWFLLKATLETNKPFIIRYAGVIEKEEKDKLWIDIGKDFINPKFNYIFPSAHTKKTLEQIHHINLPKYYVVHQGISREFTNDHEPRNHDKFRIGLVGRMHPVKNFEFCIPLASALKSENNSEIQIITDLELKFNEYGKNLIKKFKNNNIILKPKINSENLANFYKGMDLIITPSYFETYGHVPLEAIATGTPALINKTVGAKEVFKKLGLEDYVVDFGNFDAVLKKIRNIKRNKIFINGDIDKTLIRDHSWSITMTRYFNIFDNVIKSQTYPLNKIKHWATE